MSLKQNAESTNFDIVATGYSRLKSGKKERNIHERGVAGVWQKLYV